MPVRVDGPPAPTIDTPDRAGDRDRRPLVWAVVAVAVAVLVGVLVGSLLTRGAAPAPAGPDPEQPAGVPASQQPSGQQPSSQAPRVTEALPRSVIVAGEGGISNIYELRTGYPKTTEGAVQAVMNFLIVDSGPAYYNQTHYEAIQAYMYSSPEVRARIGYRQSAVDARRDYYKVNDQGQPLTDGRPDPDMRIWDAVYLQYGAYRIVEASPEKVRVMTWAPYVYGVDRKDATTTANVKVAWAYADSTVQWVDGDWRLSGNEGLDASAVPQPADRAQVVTSYAERASLLGTDMGWTLPANAADTDTPELQLPGK